MKKWVSEITQMEEDVSGSLKVVSDLFLVTLDHLQGGYAFEAFQEMFEDSCKSFKREEVEFCRVGYALDSLLTALFYYKQAMVCHWWQRKKAALYFNISLLDCYESLLNLFLEETGEVIFCEVKGEHLFDEVFLSSFPMSLSKKDVGKELEWIYKESKKNGLLMYESHFKYAMMRCKRTLFMSHFPWMQSFRNWGIGLSVVLGSFLFIAIGRIAYNMCVEFPLLRLLSMERAGKAYDRKLVEVALQCRSFIDNGVDVFGSRILFFCLAVFLVIGIEYIVGKWSDRIYR
jgi:hypothetical protein